MAPYSNRTILNDAYDLTKTKACLFFRHFYDGVLILDFKKHKRHRLKNYVSYDSYDPYDSSENQALHNVMHIGLLKNLYS